MTKEIALRNDMPAPSEWGLMRDMAASLVPTGFLPDSIKTPEQAMAIMLKGRELNVPAMYSLSNIAIVKGKPTISAEMMLALIYRDHGKKAIRVKSSDDQQCTVEYRLEGWDDISSYTFTMDQARKAGLTNNPTWNRYPAAMLRARCISAVARMAFPESIAGMYVPGELGEDVTVNDDGEVTSVHVTTGEIVETTSRHSLDDDPQPGLISWQEAKAEEERKRANAAWHIALKDAGIDDEGKAAWYRFKGVESANDVPIPTLDGWSKSFRDRPDAAREHVERLKASQNTPGAPQSDESSEQEESPADDGYEPSQTVIEIDPEFEADYRAKADQYTR